MRSVIESEMPLIVAIQHSKSGMFSKFHFTCFEWIIQGKLFHSPSFNLKNLCAVGTEEGPILLVSKLTQSIVPVCLLCVHKRKVTDIVMSHQLNTFLSVSTDGSIAGWHCSDGSCCFAYDNLVPPGEIKIVLCESDTSLAWFWTRGESASLIDLKRGTVSQKINFVGLSSFSILKKHSNFLSNTASNPSSQNESHHSKAPSFAIMAGINTVRTYQIDESTNFLKCQKVEKIVFNLGQKYNVTPNGIVVTKKNLIKIYLPNLNVPIYTEEISEISDDDMIATVTWKHPESLIISSYKGFFKIYKIQIRKNENTQHICIQKVNNFSCPNCFISTNVALNSDIGCVIFSASKNPDKPKKNSASQSTVICLSVTDQKVVKLVMPQIDKLCCIPDSNSRIVIQAEQRSSIFQIFDWGLSTSISQSISINKTSTNNIAINSSDYKSAISRSFISTTVNVNQPLKQIPSSSEVRNYSLFGKQFPLSQSVDFRSNLIQQPQYSFVLREGSIGHSIKTAVITAICCQNFNNLSTRLQIICGASDGRLYFFWENNSIPYEISDALISPVISIVLLPIRFTKSSCLIAIGKDGSFCLFKWNKLSHRYATNGLPIVAIGIIEIQRLLVIQKSDDSFTVYSMNSPEPIAVLLAPPQKTVFIWSTVNFPKPSGIQATLSLQIAGSSLFYSVLEVSKLRSLKSSHKKVTNRVPIPTKSVNSGDEKQQNSKVGLTQKFNAEDKSNKTAVSGDVNNSKSGASHNEIDRTSTQELVDFLTNLDPNESNVFTDHSSISKPPQNPSKKAENTILDFKASILSGSNLKLKSDSSTNSETKSNAASNANTKQPPNSSSNAPGVGNSSSETNLQNASNQQVDSVLDTLPKSSSNSHIYSNNSTLVRKVNTTDSNSDSTASSDSLDDLYGRSLHNKQSIAADDRIESGSSNIFTLPATSTATTENLDDSLSKISVVSKSDFNADSSFKKEDSSIDPISQTGRFTASDIRSIVAVILEMMAPTSSTSSASVGPKSKSFAMPTTHPSLVINSSIETSKWYDIDENQDGLSFVLVGHRNLPTFFYPMFKLSGPTVFDTSPFNAALHYLSYKIMSNFLNLTPNTEKFEKENKFKICGFISILTQLLFINDREIQKISALTCDRIVNWSSSGIVVPEQVWNLLVASYIEYFDKNDVADYDKFLMAIMMVTHVDLVNPIYHKIVFDFLLKQARDRCPSNFLAFNILVANFEFWANFFVCDDNKAKSDTDNNNNNKKGEENVTNHAAQRGKKELMNFLLSTFFDYDFEEKKLVKDKLYLIIKENFNSFCDSVGFLLSNYPTVKVADETSQICSELGEQHPSSIGSLGPLFLAYLASNFEKFQDVFYKYLTEVQPKFKNEIVNFEQLWIFATNDGYIRVFKNAKVFIKEKISDGPILAVSIGPNAAFAAAITKNDMSLVKIDLKSSFFLNLNKKRVIERKSIKIKPGIPFENIKIVWDNKESCHIEY